MKDWLMSLLVCPLCKAELNLAHETREENDEVESGELRCSQCNASFPIINYIPRFTQTDEYVKNFSLQWKRHSRTQYGKLSDETFVEKTGLSQEDIREKLVLDAGCGSGRFCDVASRMGGKVVGVDLSYSIDAAFQEIGLRNNVCFVQCDLLNLPFKSGMFDVAFSIGVVHHSRNPKLATKEIARLVKNSGILAIWVYASWRELNRNDRLSRIHTMISYSVSDFHRIFTSRMSADELYALISKLSFVCSLKRNPNWAFFVDLIFRCSDNRDIEMWILDTFDWYSPRYHFKHTYDEVSDWFQELGFTHIKKLDFPVAVQGLAMRN